MSEPTVVSLITEELRDGIRQQSAQRTIGIDCTALAALLASRLNLHEERGWIRCVDGKTQFAVVGWVSGTTEEQ